MQYGICPLSVVPIRLRASEEGELISQFLYGEHFKLLEQRKFWSKVRCAFDGFEGWVLNNQIQLIAQEIYDAIENRDPKQFVSDLVAFVSINTSELMPVLIGSSVHDFTILNHKFEGSVIQFKSDKLELIKIASLYRNAPYLSGGRTPFGLDSSGFTQIVYRINGYKLKRTAIEQSSQGEALSFIEESEPGDLAFFDNSEGIINHVGIIMKDNYIIHAYGKVRVDRLDHTGIFNTDTRTYTHSLRVIKKII